MFGKFQILENRWVFSGERMLGELRDGVFFYSFWGWIPKSVAKRLLKFTITDENAVSEIKKYL